MIKASLMFVAALGLLAFVGCGPSAEEQEKAKQEILQIEAANYAVDSTKAAAEKTSRELDSLLKILNEN